jgi:Arc/MetJ family transcription regulator
LLSVLVTLGVRQFVNEAVFGPDSDILGNYLQVIGSIYAFVIAFVIFVVWTQYTKTEAIIDQEVGKLRALWMMCDCYQDCQTCAALQEKITAYAAAVADEVEADGHDRQSSGLANSEWQALERTLRSFRATEPRELVVYGDILRELSALSAVRGERLTIASTRIPWVLWDLILFITALTILPFYFLPVKSVFVDIVMVASMSASLSFILLLIRDLDNPFRGVFNVSFAPFRALGNFRG